MNVIGHDHDGLHDHVRDGRLAQAERSTTGFIQQSIHGGKCLPGVKRVRRESSVRRQTVVETPSKEGGRRR
jgi:hypothetical protein